MQANYGANEIKLLLSKVKIFNKDMGAYRGFTKTENFEYAVKLSNGDIVLKTEELQDDELDALTQDHLIAIANRFVPASTTTNTTLNADPVNKQQYAEPTALQKKKSSAGKLIPFIAFGLAFAIGGIGFAIYSIGDGSSSAAGNPKQVTPLEEFERSQPTIFLFANGTYKETYLGDKIKVNFDITNNATVTSYKNVTVRYTYYTKTKTNSESKEYTFNEVFPAHSKKTVELKIDNVKELTSIRFDVINAIPN